MHKRILLAEQSDASRGVAESILRQNGYEVISVSTAEKAFEVVEFTKPDLIIVGSDIEASEGKQLHEKIQNEPRTSNVPLLVICDSGESSLPFPDEGLIRRPLDPKDFLKKVTAYVNGKQPASGQAIANPLQGANLEDEFLDAALGLDQIQVTDSEVMDKTAVGLSVPKKKSTEEKMIGLDQSTGIEMDQTQVGKVESLMIHEDSSDIVRKEQTTKKPVPSATGKIEIVTDQFGISNTGLDLEDNSGGPQDYDWFVNEMQKEDIDKKAPVASGTPADSRSLSITDASSMVDPLTPPPPSSTKSASGTEKGGVEEFIEEFKKEVDKINDNLPESIVVQEDSSDLEKPDESLVWEEKIENLTSEQLGLFTKELAAQLADRLAEKIAAKIDSDKLLAFLRSELIAHVRKND